MRPIPDILATVAEAERHAEAATRGPWEPRCNDGSTSGFKERNADTPIVTTYETVFALGVDVAAVPVGADRVFIAHSRTALPTLTADTRDLVGCSGGWRRRWRASTSPTPTRSADSAASSPNTAR